MRAHARCTECGVLAALDDCTLAEASLVAAAAHCADTAHHGISLEVHDDELGAFVLAGDHEMLSGQWIGAFRETSVRVSVRCVPPCTHAPTPDVREASVPLAIVPAWVAIHHACHGGHAGLCVHVEADGWAADILPSGGRVRGDHGPSTGRLTVRNLRFRQEAVYEVPQSLAGLAALVFHANHEGDPMALTWDGPAPERSWDAQTLDAWCERCKKAGHATRGRTMPSGVAANMPVTLSSMSPPGLAAARLIALHASHEGARPGGAHCELRARWRCEQLLLPAGSA